MADQSMLPRRSADCLAVPSAGAGRGAAAGPQRSGLRSTFPQVGGVRGACRRRLPAPFVGQSLDRRHIVENVDFPRPGRRVNPSGNGEYRSADPRISQFRQKRFPASGVAHSQPTEAAHCPIYQRVWGQIVLLPRSVSWNFHGMQMQEWTCVAGVGRRDLMKRQAESALDASGGRSGGTGRAVFPHRRPGDVTAAPGRVWWPAGASNRPRRGPRRRRPGPVPCSPATRRTPRRPRPAPPSRRRPRSR